MGSQSPGNSEGFKRDGGRRTFHPGAKPAAGTSWPRLSLHHKQLAACSLMHFVNDGLFYAIFFVIPLAALEFDLSFTQASLIKTFFSLLSSLLQYPCALLAGAISDVGLLAWGTAWVGIGMVVMGLSKGIAFLWIATLGAGMGGSAQHPVASSLISRLFPAERRGSAMGTLNFGGDVGKAAFGGLMSVMLLYFSWRHALYGVGAGAALFSILWYLVVRDLAKEPGGGRCKEVMCLGTKPGVTNGDPDHLLVDASEELPQRFQHGRFAVLSAIGVVDNATRSTLLTFLPFLYLAKGLGKEHLGIYLTLVATGGLFGKLGCGVLADYLGNISMIVGTEVLTVSLILLCLVTDPGTGLVLAAFLGFFLNGTSSVIYSQAAGIIPVQVRTRGYSIFFTLTLGSAAVVPMLFGMLGDFFQARHGEWIGVVAIFVGMAAMAAMTIPLAAVFYTLGHPPRSAGGPQNALPRPL
jgi:FSR family fosmidomycin resistance protein-like MFS transporter